MEQEMYIYIYISKSHPSTYFGRPSNLEVMKSVDSFFFLEKKGGGKGTEGTTNVGKNNVSRMDKFCRTFGSWS